MHRHLKSTGLNELASDTLCKTQPCYFLIFAHNHSRIIDPTTETINSATKPYASNPNTSKILLPMKLPHIPSIRYIINPLFFFDSNRHAI